MSESVRNSGLEALSPFVGTWRAEASFENAEGNDEAALSVFEWGLDGAVLIERSTGPHPVPDSLAIVSLDTLSGGYIQHYFDCRGVVRTYAMSFADGVWSLLRAKPDFSPLDFSQRFTAKFSEDGASIVGCWERSQDGSTWEHDFDLTYRRTA